MEKSLALHLSPSTLFPHCMVFLWGTRLGGWRARGQEPGGQDAWGWARAVPSLLFSLQASFSFAFLRQRPSFRVPLRSLVGKAQHPPPSMTHSHRRLSEGPWEPPQQRSSKSTDRLAKTPFSFGLSPMEVPVWGL